MEDGDSLAGSNSKRKGLCCLFSHRMTANYVYDTALNKENISIGCRKERRGKFKCFMERPSERLSRTKHSPGHPSFGAIMSDLGNIQLVPQWGAKYTTCFCLRKQWESLYMIIFYNHTMEMNTRRWRSTLRSKHMYIRIKGYELGNTGL